MADAVRVADQPAFVLHRYPWRETSLILDLFTRDFGRVAVVAKGAKRPYSELKSTLVNFQPLTVSYSGKNEVKTLARARWLAGMKPLAGLPLVTAFYLNELLIRLLAREDAHPALFEAYTRALASFAEELPLEPTLRRFELSLLTQIGLLPSLDSVQGAPLEPQLQYSLSTEGLHRARADDAHSLSGARLLELVAGDLSQPQTLALAKRVTRYLLAAQLGDKPLKTRQLLIDLHQL